MNFIEELEWRGMLNDNTPGIKEELMKGPMTGYIGFDPTAPSLTIGNYVQLMILSFFQKSGNTPIFLMGGATGRIGDPSGKDAERKLLNYEVLEHNISKQKEQAEKLLNFTEGSNKARYINNFDFYKDMNVLTFLRDVGKNLTVNYMMSKDAVKNRLESGLSYTEFSYQLLQAYDFLCLYREHDCRIQMGGSDQWGNITSGTEFIRRNIENGKAYAVTTPLLTKSDGKKFGKSEKGNIWLDPEMTTPYAFYQFWINADDADLPKFFRYFSFRDKTEIEELEKEYGSDPRHLKALLAEEVTTRIHSAESYKSAQSVSNILFNKKASKDQLFDLTTNELKMIGQEINCIQFENYKFDGQDLLENLIVGEDKIFSSKGELKRAIKNNAVSVNREKRDETTASLHEADLIEKRYVFIENGKKNKYLLQFN